MRAPRKSRAKGEREPLSAAERQRKTRVRQQWHGDRFGKPLPASAVLGVDTTKLSTRRRTRAEMMQPVEPEEEPVSPRAFVTLPLDYTYEIGSIGYTPVAGKLYLNGEKCK